MSAPPAGSANGSPLPGYYPDPSIPGYIRYWDGTAWVPGTSRPQPGPGEPPPEPPAQRSGISRGGVPAQRPAQQSAPPVQEETGPVFLDEDDGRGHGQDAAPGAGAGQEGSLPEVRQRGDVAPREEQATSWDDPRRLHGNSPEAGGAWQADVSRQSGFGGEQDQRVSWGTDAGTDAQAPAAPADSGDTIGIRLPRGGVAGHRQQPQAQQQPQQQWHEQQGAAQPHAPQWAGGGAPGPQAQAQAQAHAEALRQQGATAYQQGQGGLGVGAPQQMPDPQHADQQYGQAAPPWQAGGQQPGQQAGQQAERPPWAQQVHDLAQPGGQAAGQEPVTPWRPPADDPFLRAAQAQARPAGLGRRFGAALLDGILVAAVTAAAALPFVGKATDHIQDKIDAARQAGVTRQIWLVDGTTGGYLAVVLGAFLVFGLLYEALPTAKWGRTLGKKLFGLTVVDVERQDPPRFGASLRRWLVHRVLGLLVVGVVDVLWCVFDRPWRQCWHDKAARTFVAGGSTAD